MEVLTLLDSIASSLPGVLLASQTRDPRPWAQAPRTSTVRSVDAIRSTDVEHAGSRPAGVSERMRRSVSYMCLGVSR
eukprot:1503631-Rhodomonas_salina.1